MVNSVAEQIQTRPVTAAPRAAWLPRPAWSWLAVVPFFAAVAAFMGYPALSIITRTFTDERGVPTLANIAALNEELVINSYVFTLQLSIVTALGGGVLGLLIAYAITVGGLPRWMRDAVSTFSGVASNFAGVPLAFAFIATMGNLGLINVLLRQISPDFSLRGFGFNLYSFTGLALAYIYFQIPLMVLLIAPALDGLRNEWREAAESMGASATYYWTRVALPILLPSIIGAVALLFGNAFGAHATAFALTGGGSSVKVITILIGAQLASDALTNPGLGAALAFGMIVIMVITVAIYSYCRGIAERWMKR